MELDFGTGRKFTWKFLVAQVTCAILGVDFLHESRYLIDINQSSITDQVTNITVNAAAVRLTDSQRLSSSVLPDSPYTHLLSRYPDLTAEANATMPKYNIVHRIPTRGGPVYCKLRRLHPNHAADAKLSFGKLLRDGVASYSNSPWSSPLHMVPKKDDSWRPVDDYQCLNNLTTRDTYPCHTCSHSQITCMEQGCSRRSISRMLFCRYQCTPRTFRRRL